MDIKREHIVLLNNEGFAFKKKKMMKDLFIRKKK